MTTAIIGVGLIGGSMALLLRKLKLSGYIIGVDNNDAHIRQSLERGIIDEALSLEKAIPMADLIILSTPVDSSRDLAPTVLNHLHSKQTLIDVGSTKSAICAAVSSHPMRRRFVATHPMWGTEYSGPLHATEDAFRGRVTIICEKNLSEGSALSLVENIYAALSMKLVYMDDANMHDMHLAYVSHISHISSFALASTVLSKEKEERKILELASSGFETTVRLAKSNKETWAPIFIQNKKHVIDVLNEYIQKIEEIKKAIIEEDKQALFEKIEEANKIKTILK